MSLNWSDNETENIDEEMELIQPSREMPPSESEEDDDYMNIIRKKTINNDINKLMTPKNVKTKEKKQKKSYSVVVFNEPVKTERKFNPRLPPPNKK
jgi:hypothetical protein